MKLRISSIVAFAVIAACSASAQTMSNQHVSSAGVQADFEANNDRPSLSDDGRYVAFASQANNLAPGDAGFGRDIFVHDNVTGATVLVSHNATGAATVGDEARPWVSATGRYVAFQSDATDLVAGIAGNHIYRYDRDSDGDGIFDEAGSTTMIVVSVSSAGVLGNATSLCYTNSISDDGNSVAFDSDSTNLVAGDTNGVRDCFVRVISTGTTTRVSVSSTGVQGTGESNHAAISGNGAVVAFNSYAPNLVGAFDTNGAGDIFRHVRATATTTIVSVSSAGVLANAVSIWPAISDTGDRIAFQSYASNLVAADTNGVGDVFVRTIGTGVTTRVSVASGGAQAAFGGEDAFISGDGTTASFQSGSADLVGGDTNGDADVFVHVLATTTTVRANRAVDGTQANNYSADVSTSDDGTFVAFRSYATTMVASDTNTFGDIFLRGAPLLGPMTPPAMPTGMSVVDENPVTFSVNGPVDPHTEGIRYARGTPATPQVPMQPGNPIGAAIRMGPVAQAAGLPTLFPGDVSDYEGLGVPSEAVLFTAPPFAPIMPGPPPSPPDGTNNQILESAALGLISGPTVPTPAWTLPPPFESGRDNVDAMSFGEDYFPDPIMTGFAPGLPPPPIGPMGDIMVAATPWAMRMSLYAEPIVMMDAPGISFRFSIDPWAIGLMGTAIAIESGGADAGFPFGPWTSSGAAAGDVFGTPTLMRMALGTIGGGTNALVHDNPTLGLAPAPGPLMPAEDDLDALECVGDNTVPWFLGGAPARPGNLHARVDEAGPPDPAPPGVSAHDPLNDAPKFFSLTRNSPGAAFSGARSQFVIDGGNAADILVAVNPLMAGMAIPGIATNLVFADESEIGLLAVDMSPGGTGPMDQTDDLDALTLWVCPEYRFTVSLAIDEILGLAPPFTLGGFMPWVPYPYGDAYTGGGMTVSILAYLAGTGRPVPPNCVKVGFSVTTDSIGLEYTAVDYEAGPVFPVGGTSAAAGDVFLALPDGAMGSNWEWYEEVDMGEDEGAWVNGVSTSLVDLPDNLNALDSIIEPGVETGTPYCFGDGPACPCGNFSAIGAGTGCLHSLGFGARITGSGNASVTLDTLKLRGSGLPPGAAGLYFQGTDQVAGGAGAVFGDGLYCAGGTVVRLGVKFGTNGSSGYGYGEIGDAPISARGMIPAIGATRTYQLWYRDSAAFCTPSTFNLTNGLAVLWTP